MSRMLTVVTLLLTLASPALAQVVVETFDYPLLERHRLAREVGRQTAAAADEPVFGGLFAGKSNIPTNALWFLPRFAVNRTAVGDTTLWAVRNEAAGPIDLIVQYYDTVFTLQRTDMFTLVANQVRTVNVRDVPGLAVDFDGYARGMVRFSPTGPVSVDILQVDTSQNFATGGEAFLTADFCEDWQGRFLSFGPGESSVFSFLVNGPQGGGSMDPPTIVGEVYAESGAFINSFTIRTPLWFFDVPALDLVVGGLSFGSVELTIDARFTPAGLLNVAHSAGGRFSVGLRGVCLDLP